MLQLNVCCIKPVDIVSLLCLDIYYLCDAMQSDSLSRPIGYKYTEIS
jgi:hypothetical protein